MKLKYVKDLNETTTKWLRRHVPDLNDRNIVKQHVDSYRDPYNRISLTVVEGSPPKAVILDWHLNEKDRIVYAFQGARRCAGWTNREEYSYDSY